MLGALTNTHCCIWCVSCASTTSCINSLSSTLLRSAYATSAPSPLLCTKCEYISTGGLHVTLTDASLPRSQGPRDGDVHTGGQVNGLDDKTLTKKLYEAAAAGVRIDAVVRGVCRLRAGAPLPTSSPPLCAAPPPPPPPPSPGALCVVVVVAAHHSSAHRQLVA